MSQRINCLQWNIDKNGQGSDTRETTGSNHTLEEQLDFLKQQRFEILSLNEYTHSEANLEQIKSTLNVQFHIWDEGDNLLLSRLPILSSEILIFKEQLDGVQRKAIFAQILKDTWIIATHLESGEGLNPAFGIRKKQMIEIIQKIDPNHKYILIGDLNDVRRNLKSVWGSLFVQATDQVRTVMPSIYGVTCWKKLLSKLKDLYGVTYDYILQRGLQQNEKNVFNI